MASNIEFDPKLLDEVLMIGGFKYKKDAVNAALREFVERRRQLEITELFGNIQYDKDYDYKKARDRS